MCCYNSWLEELILTDVAPLGASGCLKLAHGCVCTLPQVPFPCADSPLYPSAGINYSPENFSPREYKIWDGLLGLHPSLSFLNNL